jgi:hypothetical protein
MVLYVKKFFYSHSHLQPVLIYLQWPEMVGLLWLTNLSLTYFKVEHIFTKLS